MNSNSRSAVVLETTMGLIELELYWDHTPKTCKNFSELAKRGYYNGTIFHRVIADFMAQGGDPTGTGRGGKSIYGDKFEDEIHPQLRFTGAGILAMANSGPNTNGSQFFLTLVSLEKQSIRFGFVFKKQIKSTEFLHLMNWFFVWFLTKKKAPTPHLDRRHTIFGRINRGMKVLERLGAVSVDSEDRPREPVKIIRTQILDQSS
ncbi:cyclophilin-like domain-containing protein [Melampsora americana]|nr:cyclophilin-like domain-containing protein [Melampsora americana]